MKRFKLTLIFAFIAAMVFTGCEKDFDTINIDPNNPTSVPAHLLLPSAVRQFQNTSCSMFVGGDFAGWAGQLAKVQYNDEQRYIPRESVMTSTWSNTFAISISDANQMYILAGDEENPTLQGAALVLQAWGYAFVTDIYGDSPYTEAMMVSEGIFSPAYDAQETIYDGILAQLDNAQALLGSGGAIDATSDILYQGNIANWKKFAASLKFRCLMRISGVRSVGAELQALVNSGLLFESNDEEAKLVYLSAAPSANPMFESVVFGTRGEWKVNEQMVDLLTNNNDPRLPVYVQPNGDGELRGKPSGIEGLPNDDYNYANVSAIGTYYLRPEAPGWFVSYAEIQFLMAEAVQKGLITGNAQSLYTEGIRASLEYNQIDDEAATLYLLSNPARLATDQNIALSQIGSEKWKALYCQGYEAWSEQRRTGIPDLPIAIDGAINEIPSRYTYPTIESSINKDSYEAAVAAQGADLLTTKIWWNK